MAEKYTPPFFRPDQPETSCNRVACGNDGIRLRWRVVFIAGAWLTALAAAWLMVGDTSLEAIGMVKFFPACSLFCMVPLNKWPANAPNIMLLWIPHIGWSILTLMCHNRVLFFSLFAILLLLLALDVRGCQMTISDISQIR